MAQQLTLSWVDNSGGLAGDIIQRALGTAGPYMQIAQVPPGVVSYIDTTVSFGTTYCYRVAAISSAGMSAFSDPACGNPSGGFTLAVGITGTGSGTVTSNPPGINCGTSCAYTYLAGKVVTLTATPAPGSTFSGWSGGGCGGTDTCTLVGNTPMTTTASFAAGTQASPPALTLTYNGVLRDRVGEGPMQLGSDTFLDGVWTVTLGASGGRQVTKLSIVSRDSSGALAGEWNTAASNMYVLGAASTLDTPLYNDPSTMAVNFFVPDGGTFVLFGSDFPTPPNGVEFRPGNTHTLTATFADGSTATAQTTVPAAGPATLTLAYNGLLRDRVGQGPRQLGSDTFLDGVWTVTLGASGGRQVTKLSIVSRDGSGAFAGEWNTAAANMYVLGAASTLDTPLYNDPSTMAVNFFVPDGGTFVLFGSDFPIPPNGVEFRPGNTHTLTATFSDGATATAVTTVP